MIKLSRKKITVVLAAIAFMLIAAACCLLQGIQFASLSALAAQVDVTAECLEKTTVTSNLDVEVPKSGITFSQDSPLTFISVSVVSPIEGYQIKKVQFCDTSHEENGLQDMTLMSSETGSPTGYLNLCSYGTNIFYQVHYEFYEIPSLELPDDPVKEGYVFTGWYFGTEEDHGDGENCVKYDGTPITEDTALHAHFALDSYTVTFDSAGGNAVEPQTVEYNSAVTTVEPIRQGYDFLGWFYADRTKYENQPVTENITLTAQWEIKHCKVTFYVGSEIYRELTVDWGTALVAAAEQAQVCASSIRKFRTEEGEVGTEYQERFVNSNMIVYADETCEPNPIEKYEWRSSAEYAAGSF